MKKFMCFVILISSILFQTKLFAEEPKKQFPKIDSKSGILMDFKTGKVLWEKDAHEPLAMASTTKIMTAIITLENGNLNDTVIVSSKAANAPKVKMNLVKDEEISLENLLYALMLESSNDSAIAIAEHIGGTVEGFCKMMTEKAREIGAKDTIYETPNGLDAGEHHSTSYDLAVISRYALQNEDFLKITNTSKINFKSNKKSYAMYNKNRLLTEYQGANGIKTGFTNKAGHCFVGAAKRDDMQLISVVLQSGWGAKGKEQKWLDTKEILNYGFGTFRYYNIVDDKKIAGNFSVDRSLTPTVDYYFDGGLMLPLSEEQYANINIVIEAPEAVMAPVDVNQKIGVAKIYLYNELYQDIDLLSTQSATRHDMKTFAEKIINEWLSMGTQHDVDVVLPEF